MIVLLNCTWYISYKVWLYKSLFNFNIWMTCSFVFFLVIDALLFLSNKRKIHLKTSVLFIADYLLHYRTKFQWTIEKYDFCLQVVEDGYEFFAKRQLVTLFSAPNYCGEFDNAGGMMSVDETLMCSFQVRELESTISYLQSII